MSGKDNYAFQIYNLFDIIINSSQVYKCAFLDMIFVCTIFTFIGEKAKLSEQIDAFNNLVDGDSAGDSLAGYMKPAEQLKSVNVYMYFSTISERSNLIFFQFLFNLTACLSVLFNNCLQAPNIKIANRWSMVYATRN
jgi:hypothetical protein